MKLPLRIGFAAAIFSLALGACQGSFGSSGTGVPGGVNPPVNGPMPGQMNQSPVPMMTGAGASPRSSNAPAQNVSYPFSEAAKGMQCPEQNGYTCTLYFNMTDAQLAALNPTPSPKSKNKKATASPSPTPSPTPSPDPSPSSSPSGSPSASPTPGEAQMGISLTATPTDAPQMVNPDTKAVATVPLISLRLTTTGDVLISGNASARFTLPKEQVGGRGFAIQLFHEMVKKKVVHDDFIGSYKESRLSGNDLIFTFNAPKLSVKKGDTWLVVLYGDELPSASGSPSALGSPSASASPGAFASPAAFASPFSSATPQASPLGYPSATASATP